MSDLSVAKQATDHKKTNILGHFAFQEGIFRGQFIILHLQLIDIFSKLVLHLSHAYR